MERLPHGTPVLFKTPLDLKLRRRASRGFVMGYRVEPDGSTSVNIYGEHTGGQHTVSFTEELVAPLKKGRRRRRKGASNG